MFRLKLSFVIGFLFYASSLFSVTGNITINADEFELDGEKKQIKATGRVVVNQKNITLKSQFAYYTQNHQIIELFEDVTLTKGQLNLKCDKAIAFGDEGRIHAIGHVEFKYKLISGIADEARYNLEEKKVILLGNPEVTHDGDYVIGSGIIVDLNDLRVIS